MDYAKVLNELRQKKTEKLAAAEACWREIFLSDVWSRWKKTE